MSKSKSKPVKIANPRLTMNDAMGFKFRVIGDEAARENFGSQVCYVELWKKKFQKVAIREGVKAKNSDTWHVLSSDSTAMIDLMDRLPKIAASHGLTIRNLK